MNTDAPKKYSMYMSGTHFFPRSYFDGSRARGAWFIALPRF